MFNEQDKVLVQKLTEKVDRGDTDINVYEHITACALDNICGMLLNTTRLHFLLLNVCAKMLQ